MLVALAVLAAPACTTRGLSLPSPAQEKSAAGSSARAAKNPTCATDPLNECDDLVLKMSATLLDISDADEPGRLTIRAVVPLFRSPSNPQLLAGRRALKVDAYSVDNFDCFTHTYDIRPGADFEVKQVSWRGPTDKKPPLLAAVEFGYLNERILHTCGRDGSVTESTRSSYRNAVTAVVPSARLERWAYPASPGGPVIASRDYHLAAGGGPFSGDVKFTLERRNVDEVAFWIIAEAADHVGHVGRADSRELWPVIMAQLSRSGKLTTARPADAASNPKLVHLYDQLYKERVVKRLNGMSSADRQRLIEAVFDGLAPSSSPGAPPRPPDAGTTNNPLVEEKLELVEIKALQASAGKAVLVKDVDQGTGGLIADKLAWRGVRRFLLGEFGVMEVGPKAALARAIAFYACTERLPFLPPRNFTPARPELVDRVAAAERWLRAHYGSDIPALSASIKPGGNGWYALNIRFNQNNGLKLSEHSFGFAVDVNIKENRNLSKEQLRPVVLVTGRNPRALSTRGITATAVEGFARKVAAISRDYVDAMATEASIGAAIIKYISRTRAGLPPLTIVERAQVLREARAQPPDLRAIGNAVFAGANRPVPEKAREDAAEDVVTIYKTFREKTPGSVAARGFFRLDARIVAAFAGSDAGALKWLGTDGSSDYQHFELALDKAKRASLLTTPCPRS